MKDVRCDTEQVEVEEDREGSKTNSNQQGETGADGFQHGGVTVVIPTHGLKGRLKTVVEVCSKNHHGNYIESSIDIRLEGRCHIVRHGSFCSFKTMRHEEGAQVDDKKYEYHTAGESHVA